MKSNCNLIVLVLLLIIIVLALSRVSISYQSNDLNNSNSRNLINNNRTLNTSDHFSNTPGMFDRFANVNSNGNSNRNSNGNEKHQSLYGFPEKDDYMSVSLREQIANLENKFYYDNCRFEPVN